MANWTDASTAPKRFQWEESSGSHACSASVNCGITMAVQAADFYRNKERGSGFPIEASRKRAGVATCKPTTAWDQARVLASRGVPASVREIDSLVELERLLARGKRPVVIGVLMNRMSAATRGHPFMGWHALLMLKAGTNSAGTNGFWYTDPNFSPPGGHRPDPKKGKRFISRKELNYAWIQNKPRYAVVPDKAKVVA